MCGLTTNLLGQASRTFLTLAYPGGPSTIPPGKRGFLNLTPDQPLEPLLVPPLCEVLRTCQADLRGYTFRLGSVTYPHLNLQVISHSTGDDWIFPAITPTALHPYPNHPPSPLC